MKHKADNMDCRDLMVKFMVAGATVYVVLMSVTQIFTNIVFDESDQLDTLLQVSYCYISLRYSLIYLLFFFAMLNIKARFQLINTNVRQVSKSWRSFV
jgi:hypothetical protein